MPYLLNPVGIVGLMTISAQAESLAVLAVAVGILALVLLIDAVFRWATQVSARLDENRMLVTGKVFGFLIAAIAVVQLILDGLASAGVIAPIVH